MHDVADSACRCVWGTQSFVMRSTTHNGLLVPIIDPETVNLGCRRGRPGCVRSLTRSSLDNTGDRSDPIRSHPGQWRTRVFPPGITIDHKRPVPCDKWQFSLMSEVRCHRGARIEISSSSFRVRSDTRSAPAEETPMYSPPPPDDRHCAPG